MAAFVAGYLIFLLISALVVGFLVHKAPAIKDETMLGNADLAARFSKDKE